MFNFQEVKQMWMTVPMMASKYECSIDTIRRRVKEMRETGRYPTAIRKICGVEIETEEFERFCVERGRKDAG